MLRQEESRTTRNVALIGYGAIGQAVAAALHGDETLRITHVVVRPGKAHAVANLLPPGILAVESIEALDPRPDLLLEVASHSAVADFVPAALAAGIETAIVSTGALADDALRLRVEESAARGGAQLHLLSGAIGGIDALAAYREGELKEVTYVGRKPPAGWRDTPAAAQFDLATLARATTIYEGTAREAARLYPKNANVAATVALAGLGFDRTRVRLVADPQAAGNIHRVEATSNAGTFAIELTGKPLPDNPRSSAQTVLSAVRALRNLVRPIVA
jgi:aspartate dehydrogenase